MNKHWEFSTNFLLPLAIRRRFPPPVVLTRCDAIESIPGRKPIRAPATPVGSTKCSIGARGVFARTHCACTRVSARILSIISQTGCNVNNLYGLGAAAQQRASCTRIYMYVYIYVCIYFSVILICTLGIFYHRICIRITAGAM